jgi:outer membrane protein TolC
MLICCSLGVSAQKSWTLNNCIQYAIEHNLSTKNSIYASAISKEIAQQSKRDFLPSISLNSGYNIRFGRSIDPNTNDVINTKSFSNNYSTGTSIDLFNGFLKWNNLSRSKLLYQASKENLLQVKHKLAFQVMDAYFNILFQQGLLQIAKEQYELSLLNSKMVHAKIKLGLKAKSEVYDLESTIATEKLNVIRTRHLLEEAQLFLIQLLNLNVQKIKLAVNSDTQFIIENKNISTTKKLFNNAIQFLPGVKSQELRAKASQKSLAMIKSGLYPRLSFNTGISTAYYQTKRNQLGNTIKFMDQIQDNVNKYVSFSLNIPITNNGRNRSNVKKAKIELEQATISLEQKKQEVYKIIQLILQKNTALKAENELQQHNVKSKEMAYSISLKKYQKGLLNLYELQQAKNRFSEAKATLLRITIQLRIQKKTIDFYNGIPVFNINTSHKNG